MRSCIYKRTVPLKCIADENRPGRAAHANRMECSASMFVGMIVMSTVLVVFWDNSNSLEGIVRRFHPKTDTIDSKTNTHMTVNTHDAMYKLEQAPVSHPRDLGLHSQPRDQALSRNSRDRVPVSHVGFLKVHKTGSTTVQNIFFRFALKFNLTLILSSEKGYITDRSVVMPVKEGNHYDMLACHTIYSEEIFGLLPIDTVRISIIRDPLDRAISAAYYYRDVWNKKYLERIPKDRFIENLITHKQKFDRQYFSDTNNAMGRDFGFSLFLKNRTRKPSIARMKKDFELQSGLIKSYLNQLEKEFELVMVVERFEESLILLKRTLKWRLQDIMFIKTNSHKHEPVNITDAQKMIFKDNNFIDYAIYDTFYPIFDRKVKAEGPSFNKEVDHYKTVIELVEVFCDATLSQYSNVSINIPRSKWNENFDITRKDCDFMKKGELNLIKDLRFRHELMQNIS